MDKSNIKVETKKIYLKSYGNLQLSIKTIKTVLNVLNNDYYEEIFSYNKIKSEYKLEKEKIIKNLEELINYKIILCETLIKAINDIDDEIEKNILLLRYINGETWEDISEFLSYSVRQLHNKALLNIKLL